MTDLISGVRSIKILILRFSAMGDVALLVPVIRSLVTAHSHVEVTVVTRPRYAAFFQDIERVKVVPADVDYVYKGFFGIRELFRNLMRKASYDVVIDMHDHIRTKMLRTLFRIFFTDVVVFKKGRKEKRKFARKRDKVVRPLPHTMDRYRDALAQAGLPFDLIPPPYFHTTAASRNAAEAWIRTHKLDVRNKVQWIGVAPFAMHRSKIWPLEHYMQLFEKVLEGMSARFFLFGGGEDEIRFFKTLKARFPEHVSIVAGELKLTEEIALMQQLDLMVCVDSSNMHMAALAGVPTLSLWGGTHPDVGFAPVGVDQTIIQISRNELPCRPCSVYGRENCYVGGFPCLTRITPDLVAGEVLRKLNT